MTADREEGKNGGTTKTEGQYYGPNGYVAPTTKPHIEIGLYSRQ